MRVKQSLRLAFFGSPDFSVSALKALLDAGHSVEAVYTQPAKPRARGRQFLPCKVAEFAKNSGLNLRTPKNLRKDPEEQAYFESLKLDAGVVVAYGQILPKRILAAPAKGCLNIHASLLPRFRGAAPIQAALLAGDKETGISIMQMDEGLDTGPVLLTEKLPLGERTAFKEVHDQLSLIGASLIVRALAENFLPERQNEAQATYAPKITAEDGLIRWEADASVIDRQIRALATEPGTYSFFRGERIKIWEACPEAEAAFFKQNEARPLPGTVIPVEKKRLYVACGQGVLRLEKLQRPGRQILPVGAFLSGMPLHPGERFGSEAENV